MALRGWRLFGVVGTIVAYVVGILLLSILSIQNHNPQRYSSARGIERQLSTPHGRELSALGRRQPIRWCRELRYLDGRLPPPIARPPRILHTFPGHPALVVTTKPPPEPLPDNLFSCAMSRKEGIYQRKKRLMSFDPFTPQMKLELEEKRQEVFSILGRNEN
uniref:Uncharacterized protein n=1 Tax=Phlebotomus papatasi TaxID=29031 RepID=A0A1B0D5D5_PHLPP